MKIYADPITINCRKVLAGLQLMGAPYELVHVDYFKGEHKGAEYMALNPNASVPALVDGDLILWESNAILAYAADKIGAEAVYPRDAKVRADIQRWLFWESAQWFPSCYVYLVENCVKPLLGSAPDPAVLNAQDPNFHKLASILDDRLARHTWIAGTAGPSIADIALASPMHLHAWQKLPLGDHAPLRRWMADLERQACWASTWVGEGFTTAQTLKQAA